MSDDQPVEKKVDDCGLQCVIEINRYPSGERVGRFLSTVLPFDFFILNECGYAQTLNNFIKNECRNYQESVVIQSQNGYKGWPKLKTLFDQLSKSGVKDTPPDNQEDGDHKPDE